MSKPLRKRRVLINANSAPIHKFSFHPTSPPPPPGVGHGVGWKGEGVGFGFRNLAEGCINKPALFLRVLRMQPYG